MEAVVQLSNPTTPLEASRWHSTMAVDINGAAPGAVNGDSTQTPPTAANGAAKDGAQKPDGQDTGNVSGIVPVLQNVVATVNLDCRLDLKTIALHARNAEYNPKRFAAVIMRIREPKTTALIFASGKMVVTGAKSEDDRYAFAEACPLHL